MLKFDRSVGLGLKWRAMLRMRWVSGLLGCLVAAVLAVGVPEVAAQAGSRAAERPAITGIAFARFYTTDAAAAQHFYGDLLGFERQEQGQTWIYPVNRAQWIELLTATPPPSPNLRMQAVGFTTRDAQGLERYLDAKGVRAEIPLRDGRFAVRDPEGNLIYFVQTGAEKRVASSTPSPRAASHRMIHVGFIVHDADKEGAFWHGILGFTPYWHGGRAPDRTDWISQQVPEGTDWLEFMLNPPADPTRKQAGVSNHFSLGVAHMQDAIAALARNGCSEAGCSKTQLGRDGKVQLNLFDPDDTRVEFMEFTPTREPCCSPIVGRTPTDVEDQ